ncbi:MAG: Uma2 family endonuclease [Cyanobacteria bacterium J06639_14]
MTTAALLSLKQFLQLPDIETSPAWELSTEGAVQKPIPTIEHSRLQRNLTNLINAAQSSYEAIQELRCNVGNLSPVPDISVVAEARLPETGHLQTAPDWLIEIRSPDQSTVDLEAKILHCLKHGTTLAWLIDLQRNRIWVWQEGELDILTDAAQLSALGIVELTVNDVLALTAKR